MSCTFYGKCITEGELKKSRVSNQCALNFRGLSPCSIDNPDWELCGYAHPSVRKAVELYAPHLIQFFPEPELVSQ